MKQKIFTVIGIILLLVGIVIGCFAFPQAELIGFAVAMFGAGVLCVNLWRNRKKEIPTWLSILSIVLVGIGSFMIGFLGLLEVEVFKQIIGFVIGIVVIIIGLFIPEIPKMIHRKE